MDIPQGLGDVVDWLHDGPSVDVVYGDPIERDDRTVVPVATVRYGLAGGFGSGTESDGSGGEGGGGAGGVSVEPVGALEITDRETRFVPSEPPRTADRGTLLAAVVGVVVGLLLGRRGRDGEADAEP